MKDFYHPQSIYLLNQEFERSSREYDKLEGDVIQSKNNLLEQLEELGNLQVGHHLRQRLFCSGNDSSEHRVSVWVRPQFSQNFHSASKKPGNSICSRNEVIVALIESAVITFVSSDPSLCEWLKDGWSHNLQLLLLSRSQYLIRGREFKGHMYLSWGHSRLQLLYRIFVALQFCLVPFSPPCTVLMWCWGWWMLLTDWRRLLFQQSTHLSRIIISS